MSKLCTVLDGKTVNILTDTSSSQACNVCKATPKESNDLEKLNNTVCDEDTFKSAYELELQQWQARSEYTKKIMARKSKIATEFHEEMGVVIDKPKQGGANSNDDNTARKFSKNLLLLSQVTGIDKELIERFSNILPTTSKK
ncbi:hypothetical protein JTB14_022651 [Gonioctena quinquepunctata]|nr:hypothetical protein JTB14_022651 [Gonioctena quinquepunctata]